MNGKIFKLTPVLALVFAIVCGVVRYFQIQTLTEFETGFFFKGAELGGSLIYILLTVFAVILTVIAFAGKKKDCSAYSVSSDGMGNNATRFLGIADIIGAVLIGYRVTEGGGILLLILNIAGAAALLIAGFALMLRIVPPALTGHLRLITAVFLFFRLADFFGADLIILVHAENLIILMAYVLFAAFIAAEARFFARIEGRRTRLLEIVLALLTFLCSLTHVVSDLIALVVGGEAGAFVSLNFDITAAALISGLYLFVVFFTEKKKDIEIIEIE